MPLSFFRRKKSEDQAPLTRAPERPQVETANRRDARRTGEHRRTIEHHATEEAPPRDPRRAQPQEEHGRRRRRDRSRLRRSSADGHCRAEGRAAEDRAQDRARPRRPGGATPPKRAPLPKAKRELLVSVDAGEKRVAVLEDDKVAEVYLERPERRSIAGNIYLGVVDNVLPGMEAAFVEIGLEKNGFLYVDEIVGPELEGRKGARKIQDLIQRGENVLVQAVKDPMKTKGARLTTEISLPGRFVVYVPHGEGLGVSRRLEDDERTRLKAVLKEHAPKQGGVIVRTAAEGASAEDIERDLDFLQRLWRSIEAQGQGGEGAVARLPGGRAAAARRARPLHRRLRAAARRPRPHPQADRRLPEEDLAAHGGAGHALQGARAADGGDGRRSGDPLDAQPACRSARPAAT